ncbi:MAG: translation initiation factor IF-2 [Candidatus Omnitrophota bacterium]
MSIKVSELARELKMTRKALIDKLAAMKVSVKSADSLLGDGVAEKLRQKLGSAKTEAKKPAKKSEAKKPKSTEKKKTTPKTKPAKEKPLKAAKKKIEQKPPAEKKPEAPKKEIPKPAKKEHEAPIPKTKPEPKPEDKTTPAAAAVALKKLIVKFPVVLKDLAAKMMISPSEVMKRLIGKGIFVTINQSLPENIATLAAGEFGFGLEKLPSEEEAIIAKHFEEEQDKSKLLPRAPVVTFMGHVDHGKTSLLDAIRLSKVVEKEAGGITQHIGAYEVSLEHGHVTFLDTPGHEAFTSMRARGAKVTDVVVLVVAADDGVMPQTIEAIDHAKAAEVPIVVALNKIDKPNANPDKVKKQLAELGLTPEDWGGKTITVGVSAKTGEGIDNLLEMLLLEAELLELKANPNRPARGIIIEAKLSKGGGPIATVLVQNGTLKVGDCIVLGQHYGKVRAMINDKGHRVKEAGPAKPVEVLGLTGVPLAGEQFYTFEDERMARDLAARRTQEVRQKGLVSQRHMTLEDLYQKVKEGQVKDLRIILKSDVQGSTEALKDSLSKIPTQEIQIKIIHCGMGDVSESDVILAAASDAIIFGFHVALTSEAEARAKLEKVDVRLYKIIYEVTQDIRAAMEGMLAPAIEEVFLGRAEVRQVFRVTKVGVVAGCAVVKGKIPRGASSRVIREGKKIKEGKIVSVKRFKEDVKEVAEGFECGITLGESFTFLPGDLIEAYEIVKTARRLS